jgi:molecular chaperone HscB
MTNDQGPLTDLDHFERLGLPRTYLIDAAALEKNYLERSRLVHPDHTGNAPASLEASAALNEAYAVVRDPGRRAEYLLSLAGGPSPAAVSQPPAEFLEEMLELRMVIEEAKANAAARAELERSLAARRGRLLAQAGEQLQSLEVAADRSAALTAIRQTLNANKFINGLLRDLNEDGEGA